MSRFKHIAQAASYLASKEGTWQMQVRIQEKATLEKGDEAAKQERANEPAIQSERQERNP
jgi:hypothetical protein